jgi:hypothetical protein
MVVFHHQLILSTKFVSLIESKKFPMKVLFAISYGQILMRDVDGVFLQEVLVTHLDKIFPSSSIMPMDLN